MENPQTNAPEAAQVAQTPPPAQPAMSSIEPQMPQYAEGGSTSSSSGKFGDIIKSVNWVEIGFMVLASAGLFYNIYYHRRKIKEEKTAYYDLQRQIDKLNQRASSHEMDLSKMASMMTTTGGY